MMENVFSESPRVSVVMTTYNGGAYVRDQVESILNQTMADFELIVVDDCSTDNTMVVLDELASMDERIKVYSSQQNHGLHRNLERGLSLACAPLIAISDQDDLWRADKLEVLVDAIDDVDIAYSDSMLVDSRGEFLGYTIMDRIRVSQPFEGYGGSIALLRKNCVSGHAMLFKRYLMDIALPFDDRIMFDHQLALIALERGGLRYIDEPLVRHRMHGGNQTNLGLVESSEIDCLEYQEGRVGRAKDNKGRMGLRTELADRIELFLTRFSDDTNSSNLRRNRLLAKVAGRLRSGKDSFFDLRLFIQLLLIKEELIYPGERSHINKCFKYSKGTRYYLWKEKS